MDTKLVSAAAKLSVWISILMDLLKYISRFDKSQLRSSQLKSPPSVPDGE